MITPAQPPLFVNEKECAEQLGISDSAWPPLRRKWEARGFPKPKPETKKYLWPEVLAWVLADNGFHGNVPEAADGEENWGNGKRH